VSMIEMRMRRTIRKSTSDRRRCATVSEAHVFSRRPRAARLTTPRNLTRMVRMSSYTASHLSKRKTARAKPPSKGPRTRGSKAAKERRSGIVRRPAAPDSAARPASAVGDQTSREALGSNESPCRLAARKIRQRRQERMSRAGDASFVCFSRESRADWFGRRETRRTRTPRRTAVAR
jgi:hypothetical protein